MRFPRHAGITHLSGAPLRALVVATDRARVEDEVEKRVAARTGADRLLRIAEVKKLTGLGRTTIWQLGRDGLFPKRVKLSGTRGRAVGWRESEVRQWVADRKAASEE